MDKQHGSKYKMTYRSPGGTDKKIIVEFRYGAKVSAVTIDMGSSDVLGHFDRYQYVILSEKEARMLLEGLAVVLPASE